MLPILPGSLHSQSKDLVSSPCGQKNTIASDLGHPAGCDARILQGKYASFYPRLFLPIWLGSHQPSPVPGPQETTSSMGSSARMLTPSKDSDRRTDTYRTQLVPPDLVRFSPTPPRAHNLGNRQFRPFLSTRTHDSLGFS